MGNAEPTYDVLLEEFDSIGLGDFSRWFRFDPLHEVVNCDNGKTSTSSPFWQGAYKVNFPFREWLGA